jgi:hypothetical protein
VRWRLDSVEGMTFDLVGGNPSPSLESNCCSEVASLQTGVDSGASVLYGIPKHKTRQIDKQPPSAMYLSKTSQCTYE